MHAGLVGIVYTVLPGLMITLVHAYPSVAFPFMTQRASECERMMSHASEEANLSPARPTRLSQSGHCISRAGSKTLHLLFPPSP